MKPRLTLSANATIRSGGQGLNLHHMIECLGACFDLDVCCRGGVTSRPARRVPVSRLSSFLGRTPGLRRLRDWQVHLEERSFDAWVSRNLERCDFFQGVTGQCLDSLKSARQQGAVRILDVITLHIDDFVRASVSECRKFGVRAVHHPWHTERIKREYEQADLIRVMSHPAQKTFLDRGFSKDRVFVATPPIDVDACPVARFRDDTFRISFVGLLEPAKGFHYLIEAFRSLKHKDTELLLWGNTGSRGVSEYIRTAMRACPAIRLVPETVSQVGFERVYASSSVLVHPSLADGFGYVVSEAMACGIPVITTSATGASQCVVDGANGFIVPPGNTPAIIERLEYLIEHPARLKAMGAAARESARALTMSQFREAYERVLFGVANHA